MPYVVSKRQPPSSLTRGNGNGHSSATVLIEAQAEYLVRALEAMRERGVASLEPRRAVQGRWNEEVQRALAGTVWNAGGCASYYLDRNGRNPSIYPWTTVDLRRRLRRFDPTAYTTRVAAGGGALEAAV